MSNRSKKSRPRAKPNNAIRQALIARAKIMMDRLAESNHIEHKGTKGSLREAYLRDFLVTSFAHRFDLTSGFITDALGTTITPQIDLIIYDNSMVPAIILGIGTAIVPFESVRCICEVKSILQTDHERQILKQSNAIKSLYVTGYNRQTIAHAQFDGMPVCVFCYQTDVALETLKQWFEKNPKLVAVCVVKRFLIWRSAPGQAAIVMDATNEYKELLVFVSCLFDISVSTQISLNKMGFMHSLKPYLQADELKFPVDGFS